MTRVRWRQRVGTALLFALLVGALLWYVGSLPAQPWLAALVMLLVTAAGGLLAWVFTDHVADIDAASWHLPLRQEAAPPVALDYRLVRLRRDLRDALERRDRPDTVHALVCDLTVDRLRAHQGIDARTDPSDRHRATQRRRAGPGARRGRAAVRPRPQTGAGAGSRWVWQSRTAAPTPARRAARRRRREHP